MDGIHAGPILEVDAAFRKDVLHRLDELVDERVEIRGRRPRLAQTEVQRIAQVLLVVRSRVGKHRKEILRGHSGTRRIELQLSDGDACPIRSRVAQSEYSAPSVTQMNRTSLSGQFSSVGVGKEGRLTLVDCNPTGNAVDGKSGSANALAYAASSHTFYVLHCFGPDHFRLMSVGGDGKLTLRPEKYSANTQTKTDRVTTMAMRSPDERFLMVGNTFDERPSVGPDAKPKSALANTKDPDGLVVFRPDHFIIGLAVGNGCVMCTIDTNGRIETDPLVPIDTSGGKLGRSDFQPVSQKGSITATWRPSFRTRLGRGTSPR